jgi:acylphosphatase
MIRRHAVVHGEVQGVGFRYAARQKASELGLTGFVRNRADGSVEAEIEGPDAAVHGMLEWLGVGPAWARVTAVDVDDRSPLGESGFRIRR